MIELGVASLKIEGRLKTPEYVANITRHYRAAIDAAWAGQPVVFTPRDVREMQLSFSRGFSHGFLDGNNHKVLVRGDYAKKRGIELGVVEAITGVGVTVDGDALRSSRATALVFDGDESVGRDEQGGPASMKCSPWLDRRISRKRPSPGRASRVPSNCGSAAVRST